MNKHMFENWLTSHETISEQMYTILIDAYARNIIASISVNGLTEKSVIKQLLNAHIKEVGANIRTPCEYSQLVTTEIQYQDILVAVIHIFLNQNHFIFITSPDNANNVINNLNENNTYISDVFSLKHFSIFSC